MSTENTKDELRAVDAAVTGSALYGRVVAPSDDPLMHKVWKGTPWMMDAYTGKVDGKWGAFRPEAFRDYARFLGVPADAPDPAPLWTNDLIAEINNFDEAAVIAKARNYKPGDYK